ncbi:MAG: hypothetical protein Q4G14_14560 [Paracoccus sp. (in: a-proteobacteria)]|uniref:hypothetical protein n=1 Tax=Paracoccus sp. TaxID=267 RepID=UPI0026E00F06|nr:hypothetical protein [Paracoccus sp. (in: a-proteobacteria)]MDO5614450.1 hypothetical protein [Paracoccus sp. (in: a-proteobacteria)]
MTRKTPDTAAPSDAVDTPVDAPIPANPSTGGSYIRHADGRLTRVGDATAAQPEQDQ